MSKDIKGALEAILFAADAPVGLNKMAEILDVDKKQIEESINNLKNLYDSNDRGIDLYKINDGYQMRSKPVYANNIRKLLKINKFFLSKAALETLAVVAYEQPVIKARVDEVRGVDSSHLIRQLIKRKLISFAGKSDLIGKPMTYKTTKYFLEVFSLSSIKDLPDISELEKLDIQNNDHKESVVDYARQEHFMQDYSEFEKKSEADIASITNELSSISKIGFIKDNIEPKPKTTEIKDNIIEKKSDNEEVDNIDSDKALDIRARIASGREVSNEEIEWLKSVEKFV